ncbi:antibiotic biosynthesis monooxygenase [Streptomyces platensis subsp. clarensis]|uniref:Antibiotic biosynthesis monooxygenase n=1 Tax=Streptomyces showdoensis TaxID=68268 RepID=A0A2P2GF50_STREW|nr:antibiotic biosynthesis monooxygenase [Streptomyces showdoensis]KKZ70146.1 antibiotic biosynthesis monooxygenase [Streptomyces showdoensis]MCW7991114.1 antibiotic biosynthesis monooxygenase [Streptomyces platensis subsp. clarensis]
MTQSLVGGFEPPYYTAVFTAIRPDAPEGYAETAATLHALVRDIPGFLGYESAGTPGGIGITVAYFRDLEGLTAWQHHPEHLEAKRRGRAEWYDSYRVHIGKVERTYGFDRDRD